MLRLLPPQWQRRYHLARIGEAAFHAHYCRNISKPPVERPEGNGAAAYHRQAA